MFFNVFSYKQRQWHCSCKYISQNLNVHMSYEDSSMPTILKDLLLGILLVCLMLTLTTIGQAATVL